MTSFPGTNLKQDYSYTIECEGKTHTFYASKL